MLGRWAQRFSRVRKTTEQPGPATPPLQTSQQPKPCEESEPYDNQNEGQKPDGHRCEILLRTEPRKRWDASIKPEGSRFTEIVRIFEEKLNDPKATVQDVLEEYFTKHERNLLIPADKRRNRVLAKIQRRNRVRYRMLLRSQRFSAWAGHAKDLHLKLAMLWFGLPVAPIEFSGADELESGSDTSQDIAEAETDERREEAATNEKTLRFLNEYGERHFGMALVRRPDPTYEAYYALNHLYPVAQRRKRCQVFPTQTSTISLRGGGLSEDLLDMDPDEFNESDIEVEQLSDSEGSDGDQGGQEHASSTPDNVSLRPGAANSPHPLMRTAMEVSDSLYRPKENSRPRVRFEPGPAPNAAAGHHGAATPGLADHAQHPLGQEQRRREMREATYSMPPSVHTDNTIPVNAPPIEEMLQFGFDNLPSISLGVLTPTEQRKMQIDYYHMRNILLERSQKCPYRGCDRVISLAEDDRMQEHLAATHAGDGCNFCDEVLYQHWTVNQRRAHFLSQHSELFLNMWHVEDDNSFRAGARPHGQVDWERESRYRWCPRCGRDHNTLDAKADREHHDSVCYPGAPEGEWVACDQCGVIHDPMQRHTCREVVNTMEWPYCHRCGLGMGLFSDLYRAKHQLHCMGFYSNVARRCPWCQVDLEEGPRQFQRLAHIERCDSKPDPEAQGPLDPETGGPWPFLPRKDEVEGEKDQEPPQLCAICDKTIIQFDAHLLLKHIEEAHPDFTDFCIFCKLDYGKRGWLGDRKKRLLHLDDHIHDRKAKMAADLAETTDLPYNHPYRRKVIGPKDYELLKDKRDLEHCKKLYEGLVRVWQQQLLEVGLAENKIAMLKDELRRKGVWAPEVTADTEAGKGKEAGLLRKPETGTASERAFVNPFAPNATTAPSPPPVSAPAASAAPQQKKDKGKGKAKAMPAQKEIAKPATTTAVAPQSSTKRKTTRSHATSSKVRDPAYRPSTSSSSSSDAGSSTDNESGTEETNSKRATKRRRTVNKDPSYRPRAGEEEEVEADMEEEERIHRQLKGVRSVP